MPASDAHEFVDALVQVGGETLEVAHRAVMRQRNALRPIREQPVDRCVQRLRVELHGRRRREHEGPRRGVELAIRDAEGVAAENDAVVEIDRAIVMPRMTRRIEELERASAEPDPFLVLDGQHPSAGSGRISP